jgi:hypothetical protein
MAMTVKLTERLQANFSRTTDSHTHSANMLYCCLYCCLHRCLY